LESGDATQEYWAVEALRYLSMNDTGIQDVEQYTSGYQHAHIDALGELSQYTSGIHSGVFEY
jgi:hypothetical protein